MADLDDWTFEVEELSAGVYRVRGVDRLGRSLERTVTETDVEAALAAARDAARAIVAADPD